MSPFLWHWLCARGFTRPRTCRLSSGMGGREVGSDPSKHYGLNIATRVSGRGGKLGIDKRRGGGGGGLRWEAGAGNTECRMDGRVRMLWHGPGGGRAGQKKRGGGLLWDSGEGDTRGQERGEELCCVLLVAGEERGDGIGGSFAGGWFGGGGRDVQYLISCLPATSLERHGRRVCVVSGKSGVLDERRRFEVR